MPVPPLLQLSVATVDLERREVHRGDALLPLTELEAALLERLALSPGEPTHRDTLLVEVWGFPKPVATRAVDNTVSRLRQKIEADPDRPEHLRTVRGRGYLLELAAALAPALPDAPPRAALEAAPLPTPPTRFFGRRAELDALEAALADGARLLVVTGLGGSGKTRLVARWMERTERRVLAALDLSDARDVDDLLRVAGAALRLPPEKRAPGAEALGRALAHAGEGVVVLDNLEQLLEALPGTLARWVAAAPRVQFLATSRVALRLSGERRLSLGPLEPGPALALFESRMEDAAPRALGSAAERARAARLLDGLGHHPLSVELLAARARAHDLGRLAERMGLGLLSGGPADAAPRHRSLEATLQGSWALMAPEVQGGFAAAGALAGPFDADLAEVALGDEGLGAMRILDELIDAGVLRWDPGAATYRMLLPVREFAAGRLAARAEAEAVMGRAARFLVARAERAIAHIDGPHPSLHLAQLRADRPHALHLAERLAEIEPTLAVRLVLGASWKNLGSRAPDESRFVRALSWAEGAGDMDLVGRVRAKLASYRMVRGDGDGAEAALAPVLEAAMQGRGHPDVLAARAYVLRNRGRHAESLEVVEAFWAHAAPEPGTRGEVLIGQGISLTMLDRQEEAERVLHEAVRHCDQHRLREHAASARSNLVVAIWGPPERDEEAKQLLERALRMGDAQAHPSTTAWRLNALAWLAMATGEMEEARRLVDAAERTLQRWGSENIRSHIRGTRAWLASFDRDLDAVEAYNQETLIASQGIADPTYMLPLQEAMGGLAARRGHLSQASAWYEQVDAGLAAAEGLPAPMLAGIQLLRGMKDIALARQDGARARAEAAVVRRREAAEPWLGRSLYVRLVDRLVSMELSLL
ncbi:MAG: winged helix-turn-helix domain-containing protein [Alphaproteobacteria bacterium]|nr:winged helix-turn-helix domain-containing protein [Alphaproteobacteria bacterium]